MNIERLTIWTAQPGINFWKNTHIIYFFDSTFYVCPLPPYGNGYLPIWFYCILVQGTYLVTKNLINKLLFIKIIGIKCKEME